MDVLADAQDLLADLGVRFEANANEAAAAAMLAASVHYPIRGAVTFKGPVGVNVASDALANLSSSGVTGGALIIVGEDYGEGSSIMQERTQPFRDEITILAFGPAPQPARRSWQGGVQGVRSVRGVEHPRHADGAHPVVPCHRPPSPPATTSGPAKPVRVKDALSATQGRTFARVVLPPMSYAHEQDKVRKTAGLRPRTVHSATMG